MKNLLGIVVVLGFLASTAVAQVSPANQGATVWFYRHGDSPLPQDIPTLYEFGGVTRPLGRLAPGQFFGYSVSPGRHEFSYKKAPARGEKVSVLVKAGQQAYVEVQFRDLQQVPADRGESAMRGLRAVSDENVLDRSVIRAPGMLAPPAPASAPLPIMMAGTINLPPRMDASTVVPLPDSFQGPTIITWPTVASRASKNASSPAVTQAPTTTVPATVTGPLPGAAVTPPATTSRAAASNAPPVGLASAAPSPSSTNASSSPAASSPPTTPPASTGTPPASAISKPSPTNSTISNASAPAVAPSTPSSSSAALVAVSSVTALKPSAEEIQTALSQAEALYYKFGYEESIRILRPLDLALREQPGRISEGVNIKLLLAVAHMALNQTGEARMRFEELCRLDPAYVPDSSQFPPKVIALFNEARAAARK